MELLSIQIAFISALRSKKGLSYKLVMAIGSGLFDMNISVPLILEYEGAAKRLIGETKLTSGDIDDIIDYICSVASAGRFSICGRPFKRP